MKLLPAVAIAGILLGCGGGSKEEGADQNQSSGDKGNSKGGGNEVALTVANQVKSVNNAKSIGNALVSYFDSKFKMPPVDEWGEVVLSEIPTLLIFYSPQHPDTGKLTGALPKPAKPDSVPKDKRVSHYAFNKSMAGDGFSGSKVLVFECELGWNGAGGLEDALKYMEKHKLEKIAVSLGNGSSRSVTQEELKKLKW